MYINTFFGSEINARSKLNEDAVIPVHQSESMQLPSEDTKSCEDVL